MEALNPCTQIKIAGGLGHGTLCHLTGRLAIQFCYWTEGSAPPGGIDSACLATAIST